MIWNYILIKFDDYISRLIVTEMHEEKFKDKLMYTFYSTLHIHIFIIFTLPDLLV